MTIKTQTKLQNQTIYSKIFSYIYPVITPLLFGLFPAILYFSNNASLVLDSSLIRILGLSTIVVLVFYLLFLITYRFKAIQAANVTSVFLLFFNTYGIVYNYLFKLDVIRIEQYSLLPLYLLIAIYASWLVSKVKARKSKSLWRIILLISGALIVFNVVKIIPAEISKNSKATQQAALNTNNIVVNTSLPDIYYIVFDEFSGFETIREYFNYQDIDKFDQYLKQKGFYVIEGSQSNSTATTVELATRLNYQQFTCCKDHALYFSAIANSKVSSYLKAKGYTTIAFEEMESDFPTAHPLQVDYSYKSDPNSPPITTFLDDFGILVIDKTMVSVFQNFYKTSIDDPVLKNHRNMIFFTVSKMGDFEDISGPKFIYVHLLFPHIPFMFDKDGGILDPQFIYNWNYYLGNYIYSINIAEQMVDNILSKSDPNRPPIIILQSDHGARNGVWRDNEDTLLPDYTEELKHNILFAMYMPGYSFSGIEQDLDPINTFPIVFNYLFNDNIPIK